MANQTRSQAKLAKAVDVDALIKSKKDAARVEALDDEATIKKSREKPKKMELARGEVGQSKVAGSPSVTPKK